MRRPTIVGDTAEHNTGWSAIGAAGYRHEETNTLRIRSLYSWLAVLRLEQRLERSEVQLFAGLS